jgi:penicillin-binding protein 1A
MPSDNQNRTLFMNKEEEAAHTTGKRLITLLLVILFISSVGLGAGICFLKAMYDSIPSFSQLQSIEPPLASKMLGFDGSLVHEFSIERRTWVPLDKIPTDLQHAVIAIEDRRFFSHWGIDIKRIFGAFAADLLRGHIAQGGSTITQQLARNVYLTSHQSVIRKIREALTAIKLESSYTKTEILEFYLNQVYLGAGVYGMQAAAQQYFSKDAAALNLNECAALGGIIQLPEYYRPDREKNLERATERRNAVLKAMRDMRFIDPAEYSAATASPLAANPRKDDARSGAYFIDAVRQYICQKYGDDKLYNGGLVIYSTMDPVAQAEAEKASAENLVHLQKICNSMYLTYSNAPKKLGIRRDTFMAHFDSIYKARSSEITGLPDSARLRIAQTATVALEAHTGEVRVLIGGRSFDESKFNRAMQAYRQPGSAFKPFVYTAAMDNGMTPVTVILDQPVTLNTPEGEWRPANYDGVFNGPMTIKSALARSINLVAVQVLMQVTPEKVVEYAHKMGISNSLGAVPALAIGACEVLPIEIITAYSTFPNGGILVTPYFIKKICDKNGRILEENLPKRREAISPQTAFIMADMMSRVVCCGTAATIPALGFTRPAAGKTGTTNDFSDAWFIGYTPQIVCGVWVGVDERRSLGSGVTGSVGAIPVWVPVMTSLHRNLPVESFSKPGGVSRYDICTVSHKLATPSCPEVTQDYLIDNSLTETCDIHVGKGIRRSSDTHQLFDGRHGGETGKTKKKKQLIF